MANRYWVGGTGTITSSGDRWSVTSGGTGGATLPGVNDIAIFDENSGGGVVTFSSTSLTLSGFDSRGFTGTFTCDASAGGFAIRRNGTVYLRSTLNNTLAPGFGIYFQPMDVTVNNVLDATGANWPVDFFLGTSSSNCTVSLNGDLICRRFWVQSPSGGFNAVLNTSGFNITSLFEHASVVGINFQSGTSGNLSTSTITAQRIAVATTGALLTTTNTIFRIKNGLTCNNGFVLKELLIDAVSGTDCTISNRIVVNKISNINKTVPFRLILPNITGGNNLQTDIFDISGSPGAIVDIRAGASAQYMALIKSNSTPVYDVDYLRFYYVTGTPSTNVWYVGANSTAVGGTPTGLIFAASPYVPPSGATSNSLFFGAFF